MVTLESWSSAIAKPIASTFPQVRSQWLGLCAPSSLSPPHPLPLPLLAVHQPAFLAPRTLHSTANPRNSIANLTQLRRYGTPYNMKMWPGQDVRTAQRSSGAVRPREGEGPEVSAGSPSVGCFSGSAAVSARMASTCGPAGVVLGVRILCLVHSSVRHGAPQPHYRHHHRLARQNQREVCPEYPVST